MKLARITAVIALATLATTLTVSANEEGTTAGAGPSNAREMNERTMTRLESIRNGRSERSDPNWDRVESQR